MIAVAVVCVLSLVISAAVLCARATLANQQESGTTYSCTCYSLIRNLARFEAGWPILKRAPKLETVI